MEGDDSPRIEVTSHNSFFDLDDHDTDVNSEVIAGATTFLAMAYIIVVNPFRLNRLIKLFYGCAPITELNWAKFISVQSTYKMQ
jgi:xanthine/uracil/vitamin C permease (AzgA family)